MCVAAREQTAGRGRYGRNWVSKKDAGLYFSIVLRPKIELKFLSLITLMTAVVVYEVLAELYKLQPDIKWSNDVLVDEKKISGILAETCETKKGLAVIVGIGINLTSSNFPPELQENATSIEAQTNQKPDAEVLLQSLTKFFDHFYHIFQNENGAGKIREEWKQRSSYVKGKKVRVFLENEEFCGTTCGLEENGALRVKKEKGELIIIQAGNIEKLRSTEI